MNAIIVKPQKVACVADICRSMGLQVGDTIEGTETYSGNSHTARLTLLWLGKERAAWLVTQKRSTDTEWSEPQEATNWCLDFREWKKI